MSGTYLMSKEDDMANYQEAARAIISAVGGKDNVSSVTHCMTRLRFNLKDEGVVDDGVLEKLEKAISVVHAGGQVQLVIGPRSTLRASSASIRPT